jgi:hypothetical protein
VLAVVVAVEISLAGAAAAAAAAAAGLRKLECAIAVSFASVFVAFF